MNREKESYRWSKRKIMLFSAAPAVLLFILVAVSAEIGLRLHYSKIERITGLTEWNEGLTYHWDLYDPVYGWTNLPGYRSDSRAPFRVTISDQGLRGRRHYGPYPAAGVRRIAALGDSCTFGEGVDDDQTLPHYLQLFLGNAEVLNFGVNGYGIDQMVLRLEREVFAYHPDHVVLLLTVPSDLERATLTAYSHPKPAFTIEENRLVAKNIPVPAEVGQSFLKRRPFAWAWLFGRHVQTRSDKMILSVSRELVEYAKSICSARGVKLTIVPIAGPSWLMAVGKVDSVNDWMSRGRSALLGAGSSVVDQIDFLAQMQQKERDVTAPDGAHWGARGNCFLAEHIAHELLKRDGTLAPPRQAASCATMVPARQ